MSRFAQTWWAVPLLTLLACTSGPETDDGATGGAGAGGSTAQTGGRGTPGGSGGTVSTVGGNGGGVTGGNGGGGTGGTAGKPSGQGGGGTAGTSGTAGNAGAAGTTGTGGTPAFNGQYCEGTPRHVVGVVTRPAESGASVADQRAYMLETVNKVRAMTGLPPLVLDDCLNEIADAAIADVAAGGAVHDYFKKNCLNASTGYGKSCKCNWAQENFGAAGGSNYTWKDDVNVPLCGMMDEPKGTGHRGNIESKEWKRLGVGFRPWGKSGLQWVQEFGR